jgi:hypothetical protein
VGGHAHGAQAVFAGQTGQVQAVPASALPLPELAAAPPVPEEPPPVGTVPEPAPPLPVTPTAPSPQAQAHDPPPVLVTGQAQVQVPPPALPLPAPPSVAGGGAEQSHCTAGQLAFAGQARGCTQAQPPPEASRA